MIRGAAQLAISAVLSALAAGAHAHGRFPELGAIVFHPTDPRTIVARSSFGLVVTRDGGGEWRWICQPAVGGGLFEDPTVVIASDGDLIAGVLRGMRRGAELGCEWGYPDPDLTMTYPIDTVRDPARATRLLTITSSGVADNAVWASEDEGVEWSRVGEPIPDILFATIRVAPSDPTVVYLSGAIPADADSMTPRRVFVSASTDGGVRFDHHQVTLVGEEENVRLLGVDPADPRRLYAATRGDPEAERLLVSEDGAMSFVELLRLPAIDGFAQTADGETVWVGGDRAAGLHRSTDHGVRFERTATPLQILCLALRDDGELWACADQPLDGFAIGVSRDGGESFEPVLRMREIAGPVSCADGAATTCPMLWPDIAHDLGVPGFGAADAGPPDAGAPPPPPGGGGCGCRTTDGVPGTAPAWFAVVLALALCWRRWWLSHRRSAALPPRS